MNARYRLVLAASLTATVGTAVATAHGDLYPVRRVLFISDRQQARRHVFAMDTTGQRVLQLTGGSGQESSPSYTREGKILFASNRGGTWQVFRMNPDGTGVVQVTNGEGNNYSPAAARDGSVVFVSDRTNGITQLFLVKPGAGEPVQLTLSDRSESNSSPVVTEDMRVIFGGRRGGKQSIWQMSLDGKDMKVFPITVSGLVDSPGVIPSTIRDPLAVTPSPPTGMLRPAAPPQHRLVFTVQQDTDTHIYRMWFNGDDLQQLTDTRGFNGYPVVLPDGRILYTSDRDGSPDVWIASPDGKRHVNLTKQIGKYNATR